MSHAIESHLVVSYWFVGRGSSKYMHASACILIIYTLRAYTVLLLLYVQLIHSLVARLSLVCCILRVYITNA